MNHTDLQFKSLNFTGLAPGARLIVTGAVHGNETCGTKGITRVLSDIEAKRLVIKAGSITFVPVTNPLAYAKNDRVGDRNLNRNLSPTQSPVDFEDRIANWLCPLLAQHDVLLDLHSTRARTQGFAMLGPQDNDGPLQPFKHATKERALARRLGVGRFVDGWLETYARGVERRKTAIRPGHPHFNPLNSDAKYGVGTTEYMRSTGGYAITLECGQHDDPESEEVAYRAIVNTLAFLGHIEAAPPAEAREVEELHMYEVIDRNHEADSFSREWASFDRLTKGDLIGVRHDGARVMAEKDGYILFPDHKSKPGNEWFYLARTGG